MKKILLLHLLLAMFLGVQTAGASVVLNATNFPDDNFRTYVSQLTGVSVGSTISDAKLANVKEISADHLDISSLQGIEYFTELTELVCRNNNLTSLDVKWNTKLTSLNCNYNQLTSLDLSRNTMLEQLVCDHNNLTLLNVIRNTSLEELYCHNNNLTSLDVLNNTELTYLSCHANQLTSLDLSNNTNLSRFYCSDNQLTSLDLSNNTKLINLSCYANQLTSLDVSKNTELTALYCDDNQLTWLDVSKNTNLTFLYCATNKLTSLNVSNNTELTELDCSNNRLTSLDVSKNTKLTQLECNSNRLTSLDVSKNIELTSLTCTWNQLSSLDVSKNTLLKELRCQGNNISYLYLSKNTELEVLGCYSNKIDQLNLSNNTKLTGLYCQYNYLTNLNLDNNTALTNSNKVNIGGQSSTRRFQIDSYNSNRNNCWTLYVGTTDASRIRNLKIDDVSKTPKVTASGWLVVSEDLKKIPQKVEYEIYTGNNVAGWMPVAVNYDVKKYGVYIAGEELTSLNFYDIPGLKEGTAYFYDESSGLGWSGIYPTLVLYDAKIEGVKGLYNNVCYDLKIIARGNNSITATDWTGFDTDPAVKTTISGGGTLWITATGDRNGGIYNSDASTLKITDGTKVISQGDGYGFFDDGGTLYIQDNSILACYGNESASVELPTESKCKFDSNIGIRYPVGAYIGNSYHVFYAGTTTDVQRDWVVIGPDNQATQDLIVGLTDSQVAVYTVFDEETGTLTYYYDDQKAFRPGTTELYNPVGNPDAARFADYYKKVTKAVIDPSMKEAPLTSMRSMFYGGTNPETWAMQSLRNMTTIEGLENLNTENVTDMNGMFTMCAKLTTLDLSTFNTSNVTTFNGMFMSCDNLEIIDVSSFDISKATDMEMMFASCPKLTTICCLGDWSTSTAKSGYMFSGSKSLVGGKGTVFDSNVIDATYARPDGGTASPGYFTAETITGIQDLEGQKSMAKGQSVYNLAGQRLSKPMKGINIVGGKKIIRN